MQPVCNGGMLWRLAPCLHTEAGLQTGMGSADVEIKTWQTVAPLPWGSICSQQSSSRAREAFTAFNKRTLKENNA